MTIDLENLVAPKGYAERDGQSRFPHDAWGGKYPVAMSPDLARILQLPRRAQELDGTERAEAMIDLETERYARAVRSRPCLCAKLAGEGYRGCITRLRLVQAQVLREIRICGGLLGPIGVGHGKTIVDLLGALAFAEIGIRHLVLLVPPNLATQLVGDYELYGQHFHMPQIVFHGISGADNVGLGNEIVPLNHGAPVMHVVKYSLLSRPTATDWFERALRPEAIIADECHKLSNTQTATGGRVDRWMREHPKTLFAGWSGSMTRRSLRDYDHLAMWALRGGSPLPTDPETTEDWCRALDPSDDPADPGPLMYWCQPGEHVIDGFRRRLAETTGVVCTMNPSIDCELRIEERPAPAIPPAVQDALDMARAGVRPDGWELEDSLSIARCCREIACGFYYKWIFPHNVFPRDQQLVDDWFESRQEYAREVRRKLLAREEHLDSPILCQHAAERAHGDRPAHKGLPTWMSESWPRWAKMRSRVQPESKAVFIDDYLARDTLAWAAEAPGIVWYEHDAFAQWLYELGGIPVYGGGKTGGGLLDPRTGRIVAENGKRSIALSVKAHGTGRNGLQELFWRNHVPNPPANSDGWEQLLGRTHRPGQTHPFVEAFFYAHTEELRKHLQDALQTALYVEGTLGAVQKLRVGIRGIALPSRASHTPKAGR